MTLLELFFLSIAASTTGTEMTEEIGVTKTDTTMCISAHTCLAEYREM